MPFGARVYLKAECSLRESGGSRYAANNGIGGAKYSLSASLRPLEVFARKGAKKKEEEKEEKHLVGSCNLQ